MNVKFLVNEILGCFGFGVFFFQNQTLRDKKRHHNECNESKSRYKQAEKQNTGIAHAT